MKNCVIVTWFFHSQLGFLDFAYRVQALARHYRVTLIAREPIRQPELVAMNIECVVLPTPDTGIRHHVGYMAKAAAHIRRHQPDVVVLLGSYVAPVKLLIGDIPAAVYWNEHPSHFFAEAEGNLAKRQLMAIMRWLTYRGGCTADVAMPIGEAHQEDLLAHGANPKRVRLIYMGVAANFAPPARLPRGADSSEPLNLVYTGSIFRERGRDVMLEGLARANTVGCIATLTMVGASEEQLRYCTERARELGIADALTMVGRVPGDAIPQYLANADAGICIWEDRLYWRFNPPTKLFEYLVAGLPVLASNIRTHTDYIRSWENGVVFDYDADAFAGAVTELWRRRAELPHLRARALAEAGRYLWDNIEGQFLAALPGAAGATA